MVFLQDDFCELTTNFLETDTNTRSELTIKIEYVSKSVT